MADSSVNVNMKQYGENEVIDSGGCIFFGTPL